VLAEEVLLEAVAVDVNPAACPVHQDQPEPPERTEDPASQVLQVSPAIQENHQSNHASQLLHHRASLAQLDLPDHQDHQGPPVTQVSQVSQVNQDKTPHLENQDQKDHPDHPANQDNPVPQENPELQPKALHHNQAHQDHQETKAHLDQPDHQDNPETMLDLDPQDQKGHLDHLDHPETMVNQDLQVNQELQAMLARRVFARNTAPSTVESSSRMGLAAVKRLDACRGEVEWTPTSLLPFVHLLFFVYSAHCEKQTKH
jgi:hypothetical protein